MIPPEVFGNVLRSVRGQQRQLTFRQLRQARTKIGEEQLVILRGQQCQNISVILLQMLKKMQKCSIGAVAIENMPMVMSLRTCGIEYVAKEFFAEFLQQIILRFKMCVKGGSAHICLLNDLPYRDLGKILMRQKLGKCVKNRFSCFSLPSVHIFLHTFFRFCSIMNNRGAPYVAIGIEAGTI